jgi:hypothetical protein
MELLFPEVQEVIRQHLGLRENVNFPGLEMALGRVHIEHGSQHDPLFSVDPERPFVESKSGEKILGLSGAAVALLEVDGDLFSHAVGCGTIVYGPEARLVDAASLADSERMRAVVRASHAPEVRRVVVIFPEVGDWHEGSPRAAEGWRRLHDRAIAPPRGRAR